MYRTDHKTKMKMHLKNRANSCPSTENDVELTDAIKEHILNNRIYRIPVPAKVENPQQQITNNINYNNTMNNYISGLDPFTKLNEYHKYKNVDLIPFDRSVELMYEKTRDKLERDIGNHSITEDDIYDIYDIIDNVTKTSGQSLEDFNVLYDSKFSKLKVYESGDWKEMFLMSGVKSIINTVQDYLWNSYECYLIRRIQNASYTHAQHENYRELLKEYYSFLASMKMDPFVKGKHDNKIKFTADDDEYWNDPDAHDIGSHALVDEYTAFYTRISESMMVRDKDKWKKEVVELIKKNTKKNVVEMNKLIMSLVNVDPGFLKQIESWREPGVARVHPLTSSLPP